MQMRVAYLLDGLVHTSRGMIECPAPGDHIEMFSCLCVVVRRTWKTPVDDFMPVDLILERVALPKPTAAAKTTKPGRKTK